ncbi:MAG: SCO family protein [Solirubrobacteraceae bacterium]
MPTAGAVLLTATSLLLASCGGSGANDPTGAAGMGSTGSTPARAGGQGSLEGPTLSRPAPAPALRLANYKGREVNLSAYRGKAVLLTFIYTHCHNECPLIAAGLHQALSMLGRRAREVQVIGVTTDPKGDTPAAVTGFLAQHQMTGKMQYLIGSRPTLIPVWHRWQISAPKPKSQDVISHTALVYGISAAGKIMTVYPANFAPAVVAHDVPILARL